MEDPTPRPSAAPRSRPWRSLDQRSGALTARLAEEFPQIADLLAEPRPRREVLRLMAAALALGGLGGCSEEDAADRLIPPVVAAPDIVPGLPGFYSSATVLDGYAAGTVVAHREGRPVKVEGNPRHPASLGATDVFAQAELLDFYDPERSRGPALGGRPAAWTGFLAALAGRRAGWRAGRGLRLLTGPVTSPVQAAAIARLAALYPNFVWHRWEAVSREAVRAGARLAYGRAVEVVPDLAAAEVILAIDSDLLSSAPGHLRFARDFATGRGALREGKAMNRLYAVESTPGLTGAAADHRFVAGPAEIAAILGMLAAALTGGASLPDAAPGWLGPVAADLAAHPGRALVHLGPGHPPEAHALVHCINEALGGRGHSFFLIDCPDAAAGRPGLAELTAEIETGAVDALVILDGDPAFAGPAGFAETLARVPFSVTLSPWRTRSAALSTWHIPRAHGFEAWSEARAYDGTLSIVQPQALPLYDGKSPLELTALLADGEPPAAKAMLQAAWTGRLGGEEGWRHALALGLVEGSAGERLETALRPGLPHSLPQPAPQPGSPSGPAGLTLLFRPDPHLWDGRFAGNAWLLELPRPLSKLAWDNPLLIAPGLAEREGLANGDMVSLTVGGRSLELPVWIQPGQAGDCLTALFGFGRQDGVPAAGFDVFPLRPDGAWQAAASLRPTGRTYPLASSEHHGLLFDAGSELVRQTSPAAYLAALQAGQGPASPPPSLYPPPASRSGPAWGMSIDLSACIGCNACVVACQAENNIPVVGKDQMLREREMHWLRIDRYYQGAPDNPATAWQPVLCMQCEEAPCEVVCPVGATQHDAEGLNVMVYNRCIGTRFCSNNCPYKVRRFNYYAYARQEARPAQSRNPEVSVRGRGVMEKCTFCLQRIAAARIEADISGQPTADGALQTACQAACPTRAFTFGDSGDPASAVSRRKAGPLSYALLGELNTRPRVTYEARLTNPHPALPREGS